MTASLTPDQQRGLRDVPKSWRQFLAKWRTERGKIMTAGFEKMRLSPSAARQDANIVRLREIGRSYVEISTELHVDVRRVSRTILIHRPNLAGHKYRRGQINA